MEYVFFKKLFMDPDEVFANARKFNFRLEMYMVLEQIHIWFFNHLKIVGAHVDCPSLCPCVFVMIRLAYML